MVEGSPSMPTRADVLEITVEDPEAVLEKSSGI
jgi:hypothetical protein